MVRKETLDNNRPYISRPELIGFKENSGKPIEVSSDFLTNLIDFYQLLLQSLYLADYESSSIKFDQIQIKGRKKSMIRTRKQNLLLNRYHKYAEGFEYVSKILLNYLSIELKKMTKYSVRKMKKCSKSSKNQEEEPEKPTTVNRLSRKDLEFLLEQTHTVIALFQKLTEIHQVHAGKYFSERSYVTTQNIIERGRKNTDNQISSKSYILWDKTVTSHLPATSNLNSLLLQYLV